MNSWKRFYNMYRKDIFKIVFIVLCIIICIRVANEAAKNKNNQRLNNLISSNVTKSETDKSFSIISDQSVPNKEYETVKNVISEFMEACNSKDIDKAYDLLSEDCKDELFQSKEYFQKAYIDKVFNTRKDYTLQAWINNTYKVKIYEDMLASGKTLSDLNVLEDYYTIVIENDERKLNINSFVKKEEINKEVTKNDITIKVLSRNIYMDYETYEIEVSNKTNKTILLDSKEKTTSMYIIDSKEIEYVSYLHEIDPASLMINKNITKKIEIKYTSSYRMNVEMISLNFTDIVLDYNEYIATPDKTGYENRINIHVSF